MESDQSTDEPAKQDLKSKIAFFQNISQQATQTSNEFVGRRPPSPVPQPGSQHASAPASKLAPTAGQASSLVFSREEAKRSVSSEGFESKVEKPRERFSHTFDDKLRAKIEEVAIRKSSGWSPNDMDIFKNPMCLIGADNSNVLTISTKVVNQLEMIDWPMVVVSVVGLYRTGKSYLMNRLAQSTSGFELGDTIESKTKGIWAWCKIHPEKSNTVLLLLDTEGLGDVDKGDPNHDNKIFTLATLLCNCLVYNMKGAFDQDAVNKLTFVTEMASNIRYRGKSSEDNQTLNLILPDFVLCVRDFSLKLIKDGRQITEDEYLELSLEEKKGRDEKFNKPRECIKKFFHKRKCITFPVPGDGDVLENLEKLKFDQLSAKFKEATICFTSYVYNKKPKELVASKPVNGPMFATLANHYVTAIKHGAVPDVDDAFIAVAKKENAKIEKEAIEIFESQMKRIVMPVAAITLEQCYTSAQQTALNYLRKAVVHDKDGTFESQAQAKMDTIWKELKEENSEKIKERCETKLQKAYSKSLKGSIEGKVFEVAGGYRMFQRDLEILKDEYFSSLRDFEEHEVLWAWLGFSNKIKSDESRIIKADDAMSKQEKEDEKKRNEENIRNIMEQQKQANKEAYEQQQKDMEEHIKQMEQDRIDQIEAETKKYEDLVNEKLAKKIAEEELARYKREQEKKKNKWFGGRMWDAFWNE